MASYKLDQSVKYAKSHEWARVDGDIVVVGVSDYAQDALSDVVYVDLPEVGDTVAAGKQAATVESVKAAEDVLAPISGEVVEVNSALEDTPEIVNERPYDAWFFKVKPSNLEADLAALVAPAEYSKFIEELE
jgi:glycine cleavage system H protein